MVLEAAFLEHMAGLTTVLTQIDSFFEYFSALFFLRGLDLLYYYPELCYNLTSLQ